MYLMVTLDSHHNPKQPYCSMVQAVLLGVSSFYPPYVTCRVDTLSKQLSLWLTVKKATPHKSNITGIILMLRISVGDRTLHFYREGRLFIE